MLKIDNVSVFYGKIRALWDVCLRIGENEIVALIGANGAGKTTLLKAISGVIRVSSGSIELDGKRIDGYPPHKIVEMGIAHIPEGGRLFAEMSVKENLELGAFPIRAWKKKNHEIRNVLRIFPHLRETQLAKTLSGGERQMVAIARGLMSKPRICLFDEPSYGLAPVVVSEVMRVIRSLPNEGISVLLVEQNVHIALQVADRGYVLENGRIVLEGNSTELLQTELIKKAYLGM
ncbi:MAG: ABC transporter ATP-binding protein [Deltaproteobacteria bacterium]|nr:ABC transporter ATP-binding protein [Deltaproteobacteria bacterium]